MFICHQNGLTCHQNGLWALRVRKLLINNPAKIHQNHDGANCVGQQYIDVLYTQLDISQKESAVIKFDFSPLRSITNMRESNIIFNSPMYRDVSTPNMSCSAHTMAPLRIQQYTSIVVTWPTKIWYGFPPIFLSA